MIYVGYHENNAACSGCNKESHQGTYRVSAHARYNGPKKLVSFYFCPSCTEELIQKLGVAALTRSGEDDGVS